MRFSPSIVLFLIIVPLAFVALAAMHLLSWDSALGVAGPQAIGSQRFTAQSYDDGSSGNRSGGAARNGSVSTDGREISEDEATARPVQAYRFDPARGSDGSRSVTAGSARKSSETAGPSTHRRGNVVGPDGNPIGGARVQVRERRRIILDRGISIPGPNDASLLLVGDDGEFSFVEDPEYSYELIVEAPGYLAKTLKPGAQSYITVSLAPISKRTLTICLRDAVTQAAVADVDLEVLQGAVVRNFRSTSDGKCAIVGLTADLVVIRVSHPDFVPQVQILHGPGDGLDQTVVWPMQAGGVVEGVVSFEASPVVGATVRFFNRDMGHFVGATTTDATGAYRASVGGDGALLTVVVQAPSFAGTAVAVPVIQRNSPPVRIDVSLLKPLTLTGEVRDAVGNPIAGAWVLAEVTMADAPLMSSHPQTYTGADGSFSFLGIDPRSTVRITAFQSGYEIHEVQGLVGAALLQLVEIILRGEAILEGVVVAAPHGEPLESVYVQAYASDGSGFGVAVYSDRNGKFRLTGLPTGTYDLSGTRVGYDGGGLSGITVDESAVVSALRIILTPLARPSDGR